MHAIDQLERFTYSVIHAITVTHGIVVLVRRGGRHGFVGGGWVIKSNRVINMVFRELSSRRNKYLVWVTKSTNGRVQVTCCPRNLASVLARVSETATHLTRCGWYILVARVVLMPRKYRLVALDTTLVSVITNDRGMGGADGRTFVVAGVGVHWCLTYTTTYVDKPTTRLEDVVSVWMQRLLEGGSEIV
jgi:uncharacterized membrane protein